MSKTANFLSLKWEAGEIPPYAFCEPVTAAPLGRWCIRPIKERLFFGGGVDTPSLCGRVSTTMGGWDLEVRLDRHVDQDYVCAKCREKYKELTA